MKETEQEQLEGEERPRQRAVSREAGGKHSPEAVRRVGMACDSFEPSVTREGSGEAGI